MNKAKRHKDTTLLWKLISACMEHAFIEFLGPKGTPEEKTMRGRSEVRIATVTVVPQGHVEKEEDTVDEIEAHTATSNNS